jgi:hypothetical protein
VTVLLQAAEGRRLLSTVLAASVDTGGRSSLSRIDLSDPGT